MSLDWSITDVKDWEQVAMREENGIEGTKTNALVWAALSVDLSSITAKNVDEWMFRLSTSEKYRGAFIRRTIRNEDGTYKATEDYLFTREDLVRRIGLSTNVSTKTRTAWLERMAEGMARDATGPDGQRLTGAARTAEKARLLKEMKALAPKKAA